MLITLTSCNVHSTACIHRLHQSLALCISTSPPLGGAWGGFSSQIMLFVTCQTVGCHVSASWLPRVGQLVVTCRPVGCHVSADVLKVTLKEQQRPTCLAFLFQTYVCPFCKFTKTFLSIHGWTIIFSDYSLFRINLPTFASRIINY